MCLLPSSVTHFYSLSLAHSTTMMMRNFFIFFLLAAGITNIHKCDIPEKNIIRNWDKIFQKVSTHHLDIFFKKKIYCMHISGLCTIAFALKILHIYKIYTRDGKRQTQGDAYIHV